MSRKCPKCHRFFLNWLKANGSRFKYSPYIVRVWNRMIEFSFHGVKPSLRFRSEFTKSGGPWISVDALCQGKERDGLAQFYGAEMLTDKGWVSLGARPEFHRYWSTKEELWIDWCFERFLMWFNSRISTMGSVVNNTSL